MGEKLRLSPTTHIAGLILARGGSKQIPLKNVVPLGSKPLISWAIGAMQEFGKFDSIWVSTDHPGISECAQALGAKVFRRCSENAKDSSPSIDAVQEFIKHHQEVDIVCLIQCTSPFIQPDFLDSGYKLLLEGYDSVFSVTRDTKKRWSGVDIAAQESTQPINFNPANRLRRQDQKPEMVENGMFYFTSRTLLDQGLFQGGRCGYVEIPAEHSIEIDTVVDLLTAEQILNQELLNIS